MSFLKINPIGMENVSINTEAFVCLSNADQGSVHDQKGLYNLAQIQPNK